MEYLTLLLVILASYVLGSIPTGYWIGKIAKGVDVREMGSGSTGATNVLRCVGKKEALIVLFVDIAKGYLPVAIALHLQATQPQLLPANLFPNLAGVLAAVSSIFGHSRSIFLQFTGGKSAATGLGTLFALHPLGALGTLLVWLAVLFSSKIVSLASISAAVACPTIMFILNAPPAILAYAGIAFLYVTLRHRSNIKRLLDGTETKYTDKPKELSESSN
ncbi:MAG: glycerol-3-phosphate 1-O-acyltransferase PlsY [Cyanobacteriota/Melainabacteria group bacterium]|nr:glycerol-3-phosphate 1-O-acyltransferase PlsY [Cyanobacteria bacterium HKST-UBA01]